MNRITFRFNDNVKNIIQSYQLLLAFQGIKLSKNKIINYIILNKIHGGNIRNKLLYQIKRRYSTSDFKQLTIKYQYIINSLNHCLHLFNGLSNNINQCTKMIRYFTFINKSNEFTSELHLLINYLHYFNHIKYILKLFQKRVDKAWLLM